MGVILAMMACTWYMVHAMNQGDKLPTQSAPQGEQTCETTRLYLIMIAYKGMPKPMMPIANSIAHTRMNAFHCALVTNCALPTRSFPPAVSLPPPPVPPLLPAAGGDPTMPPTAPMPLPSARPSIPKNPPPASHLLKKTPLLLLSLLALPLSLLLALALALLLALALALLLALVSSPVSCRGRIVPCWCTISTIRRPPTPPTLLVVALPRPPLANTAAAAVARRTSARCTSRIAATWGILDTSDTMPAYALPMGCSPS
jgi:hypothetical protein